MQQEHRITYKAGITRTPSDFLCQDGELAECINLTTDNEELKPMVQPLKKYTINTDGYRLVYVHKFSDKVRYIFLFNTSGNNYNVKWCDVTDLSLGTMYALKDTGGTNNLVIVLTNSEVKDFNRRITSVGKVLTLIGKESGKTEVLMHFVWKNNTYSKSMVIPQQIADFRLCKTTALSLSGSRGKYDDSLNGDYTIKDQEEWNNLMVGLYEKNVKNIAEAKEFCKPFLVRTALELYDGTYMFISQPMMMFACVRENSYARRYSEEMGVETFSCELQMLQKTDFVSYSDYVKGVVVFVSQGVEPHELSADQGAHFIANAQGSVYHDVICIESSASPLYEDGMTYQKISPVSTSSRDLLDVPLKQKSTDDIKMELESLSLFYRLCSTGLSPLTSWTSLKKYIMPHTLENLTSQERTDLDDYHSRCSLHPEFLFSYNSRINMSGVRRGFFEGYGRFLPYMSKKIQQASYETNAHTSYDFYVQIETDEGNITVKHTENYTTSEYANYYQGIFFYYPDPRAKHVWIYDNNGYCVCNQDLKEHSGLNGAYFFRGLPGYGGEEQSQESGSGHAVANNYATEYLPNYILTTEVYNPWCINSGGYNRVDTGRIIAMSTITQALSQDQHGPSPLLIFSDSGIWGMSVDNSGLFEYTSSVSREICINPKSVIQTDNAVFFVSKKGLMVAEQMGNYRNIVVRCVSEQMNGVPFDTNNLTPLATGTDWADIVSACRNGYNDSFIEYIKSEDTFMAYDYIDSRIIITNPNKNYSFVYNIADGNISKAVLPSDMITAVNNYPDYLLQGQVMTEVDNERTFTHEIYTLYGKKSEVNVSNRSLAFLLTRPMKLAGPVSQASLRQLMNVGMWDEGTALSPWSKVETEIYVSSDMKTWYSDVSRFGAAARYFRLALYIKMLPTERLSGTILTTQERRGNNMRA